MMNNEKRFYEHQGVEEAIQVVLDHLTHRKDVEVYVSLVGDLTDLQIVLMKEMKGLQDGRTTSKYVEGDNPNNYIRGND
jgi:hypothetical protein